jgi:tetratricopeptide (TPR) repeat protein
MNLKDYTNAVKDNKKALEINPNNKSARINLSAVLNQIGIDKMDSQNYQGAILDFTKFI